MNEQETIADIIAEMRDLAAHRDWHNHTGQSNRERVSYLADRLEAAHKRERGNSAALREALVKVKKLFDGRIMFQPAIREAHEAVNAALAAPPRNCDIYLTEEAVDAATVTVRDCEACSRIDMEAPCVFCMVRWLLAPAKEGGRDGK